jgi:hypothetical protein
MYESRLKACIGTLSKSDVEELEGMTGAGAGPPVLLLALVVVVVVVAGAGSGAGEGVVANCHTRYRRRRMRAFRSVCWTASLDASASILLPLFSAPSQTYSHGHICEHKNTNKDRYT